MVNYNVSRGRLLLEHAYPSHLSPLPRVTVDVRLTLESVNSTDFQAGSWLNVIGYVRRSSQRQEKRKGPDADHGSILEDLDVQAVMIWDAGAIKVGDYEAILAHQKEVAKTTGDKLR